MSKTTSRIIAGCLALVLWTLVSAVTPVYLIPSPLAVGAELSTNIGAFFSDFLLTALESFGGLLIAFSLTCAVAVLFFEVRTAEAIGMPYAIAMKSVPVVALAPLLTIWLGNGPAGKVLLAALVCFFPLLIGFIDGLKSLPRELRLLALVWSKGKKRSLMLLHLPYAVPYILSSLKVSAPLAAVGAIVAEFSGADKGLGHAILLAAYRVETPLLFSGVLLASVLGVALYGLAASVEAYFVKKLRITRTPEDA